MQGSQSLQNRERRRSSATRLGALAAASLASIALALPALGGAPENVYAQQDGVNVYSSPTPAARVLAVLARGASVLSFGPEGEWLNVEVDVSGAPTNGWVHVGEVGTSPP